MTTAYCSLGANLGRRRQYLLRMVFMLAGSRDVRVRRVSSAFECKPWGVSGDHPVYLNAVAEIETSLEPHALLDLFHDIEHRLGRPSPHGVYAPRTADIDLILYGDAVIHTERLIVPHRFATRRAFVLKPLLEIAPEITDPASGEPWAQALQRLDESERRSCRPAGALVHDADSLPSPENAAEDLLIRSTSPGSTETFGRWMARRLGGGETIALVGTLGAGKTCWARGLARGLGIREPVTSPSYVLVKSYEGDRLSLHHADFYRLESNEGQTDAPPDLDPAGLGLEDYLEDPAAIVLVEWADNFPRWAEPPFLVVEIEGCGDEPRWLLTRWVENEDAGGYDQPAIPERTQTS